MKKIKIPSKLSAIISKLDLVVSTGLALACIGMLIVSSVQFKNSLTDINSGRVSIDTLPFDPLYIDEKDVQTYSDEEIEAAWRENSAREKMQKSMTIVQKSAYLSKQPHDPGRLADFVIVGTPTGHKQYRYGSFVADVKIDKILSSSADTSKLRIKGPTTSTYKIPPLDLREGDIVEIYNEIAFRAMKHDDKEFGMCRQNDNRYTWGFPPFRPNGQYLFFLSYAPKTDMAKTGHIKFRIVPSIYGRIPISNGKTFEPNIFCKNLPVKNDTETHGENIKRRWQEAYSKIPKFTYRDATKIDLFVDSPRTEQLYRDTAAKILQKYMGPT